MKRLNTDKWLRNQGLNAQYFALIPLELARAIKTATHLQKQHAARLNAVQWVFLNDFLLRTKSKAGRVSVTPAQCYKILNLGSKLYRRNFRHRKDSAKAQAAEPQR